MRIDGIGAGSAIGRLACAAALIVLTGLPALGSPGGTIEGRKGRAG
jgi:hypothetical protein